MEELDFLVQTRNNALELTKDISLEQLNKVPLGFNNNIIWNLGHMLVTQQLLCYSLSYKEVAIDQELVTKYRKGTRPSSDISAKEVDYIRDHLVTSVIRFRHEIKQGYFETYKNYKTSFGVTLSSLNDAITFNNIHEAMHFGVVLSQMKLVG